MTASLPVVLNRGRLHAVEAPVEFTTAESFRVELTNHGEAVHVHLHLDDDLSTVARLETGNHFVEGDTTTRVDVVVDGKDDPVTGKLKIVTGYGAETMYVDVTVEPSEEKPRRVQVDESLSKPKPKPKPKSTTTQLREAFPLLGKALLVLGALLVVAAAGVAALYVQNGALLLGIGVVLGGVVAAIIFMAR